MTGRTRSKEFLISSIVSIAALVVAATAAALFLLLRRRDAHRAHASGAIARGDLLDNIPALVWTMKPDGTAEFFNAAWTAFTGRSTAELLRAGVTEVIHPDDRAAFFATWGDALRGGGPREVEIRLRGSNAREYRWHLARAYPSGESGGIDRWVGTATDIHDRHIAFERTQQVAERLQEALAPGTLPSTQNVILDATFVPASELANVGGDWYDALPLDDRTIFFALGDVAGHGLDAAVTMSRVRQLIVGAAMAQRDPATVLKLVNRALALQETTIVTAVVGFIDIYAFTLRYATAGHPAPILVQPNGPASSLQHFGTPLNLEPELETRTFEERLRPGSLLVLYTDGLTEATRDIFNGERRLLLAARVANDAMVESPSEAIRRQMFGNERGHDDVAILTVKCGGTPVLQAVDSEDTAIATSALRSRVPKTLEPDGIAGRYGHHLGGEPTVGKPTVRRRA